MGSLGEGTQKELQLPPSTGSPFPCPQPTGHWLPCPPLPAQPWGRDGLSSCRVWLSPRPSLLLPGPGKSCGGGRRLLR